MKPQKKPKHEKWKDMTYPQAAKAFDNMAKRLAAKRGISYQQACDWLARNTPGWRRLEELRRRDIR